MTKEEFLNLGPNDEIFIFVQGMPKRCIIQHVFDKDDRYCNILIEKTNKKKNINVHIGREYFLSEDLCVLNFLKEELRKQQETMERYQRQINQQQDKMEDIKVKYNYDKLVQLYPEELI